MNGIIIESISPAKIGESLPLPLMLSNISAGFPSPAEDSIEQSIDLNELLIKHPSATFFVRVCGDSMQGAAIHSGDTLIVDRALEAKDQSIILASLNGEFTVKRLEMKNQMIKLLPEHPDYPVITITEAMDFQAWGVVTYVIHAL